MNRLGERNVRDLARCITAAENNAEEFGKAFESVRASSLLCLCLASRERAVRANPPWSMSWCGVS